MSARKKVTIAGAGNTGGEMAQRLAEKNICDVVLKDEPTIVETLHHGKALDSAQSGAWAGFESQIIPADTWEETAGSDVIVVTAGAARKPGMTREDLLNTNAKIMQAVAGPAAEQSPDAAMIIFANPMDVMCQVAMDTTGFPRERIIGQGGMLDTARFRTFVSREAGVSIRDVHGYVLGGHTDTTMVPVVSNTMIGGMPIASVLSADKIEAIVARTMKGGAEIVGLMKVGSAFQAPATATMEMVEAIILDQGRLVPCSVHLEGEYGVQNVFCGTIAKLGDGGIQQIFEVAVSDDEKAKIKAAADVNEELFGLIED